jgi:hypothetical protein
LRIGVIGKNRDTTFEKIHEIAAGKSVKKIVKSMSNMFVVMENGDIIRWIPLSQSSRGMKFDKIYIQKSVNIELDIFNCVIAPMVGHTEYPDTAIEWYS